MINPIEHVINIDLANKINMNNSIIIKKNDTDSHKFTVNIFNNSVAYSLAGTTTKIYFAKADNTKVFSNCILDGVINNKISCLLTTQAVSCIGNVAAEITIYGTAGEILTSVTFNFVVSSTTRDDAAIQSTSEFTALTNALAVVTDFTNVKNEVTNARGTFPNLKARSDSVDAQMANNVQQQGIASGFGVDENIGTNDATLLLNNYFAALKAKGIKYANFDKSHTYKVSGVLTNARDLILIGIGKIASSNLANYFINICPTLSSYNGKYNSLNFNKLQSSQFSNAFLANRNIVIGIIGDSLSTGGQDCTNISYNNINGANNSMEQGPNSLTSGDSYYQRFMDLLTTKFKDKTFDIYNRAIGGTSIQEWNTSKTFNTVTKNWIDHLKDTKCDLLLIGWGMNQTNFASAKEFKYYLKTLLDYVNANFSPVPTIVLVTSPRPILSLDDSWGATENQQAIDMTANTMRTYGLERGYYVVDVNKLSNLKRTGKVYQNPYMKAISQSYAETDALITGTFTVNGYTYQIQNSSAEMIIPMNEKSFVIAFDVKFNGFVEGDENLQIQYNFSSLGVSNLLMLRPFSSGIAKIDSYSDVSDVAHFTSATKTYQTVANWNDDIFRRITIEKRDDILDVFIDGHRILRDRIQICDFPGEIRLTKNAGSVGIITLQSIALYKGEYKQYLPSLSENEMFGLHEYGIYSTKSPYGGNGVNHPSTIALEEVYTPVLNEFINDLSLSTTIVNRGIYIPQNIFVNDVSTNTTSGAKIGYSNAPISTLYTDTSKLQNVDGTYWTKRNDITTFGEGVNLLNGEFAVYNTAGTTQIVLAKTLLTDIVAPLKFWSWLAS